MKGDRYMSTCLLGWLKFKKCVTRGAGLYMKNTQKFSENEDRNKLGKSA